MFMRPSRSPRARIFQTHFRQTHRCRFMLSLSWKHMQNAPKSNWIAIIIYNKTRHGISFMYLRRFQAKNLKFESTQMGTLAGHIVPGLALTLLGLWHIFNTIRTYILKGSSNFRVTFWYPIYGSSSKLKYLELSFVLSFSVFAIVMQILDFPFLRFSFKLDNFEHATMFLHLAVFAGFTIFAELSNSSKILSGFVGILVASVFGQELFLLHFHSADHVGVEGHYHWLLQLMVFASFMAALSATCFPTSFPLGLLLCILVMVQGCWFINMGFVLWVPNFTPQGCVLAETTHNGLLVGAITCGSGESDMRARALANMQFSWILSGILMFTGFLCLKLAKSEKGSLRGQLSDYEQLHSTAADMVTVSIDSLKQDHPSSTQSLC